MNTEEKLFTKISAIAPLSTTRDPSGPDNGPTEGAPIFFPPDVFVKGFRIFLEFANKSPFIGDLGIDKVVPVAAVDLVVVCQSVGTFLGLAPGESSRVPEELPGFCSASL